MALALVRQREIHWMKALSRELRPMPRNLQRQNPLLRSAYRKPAPGSFLFRFASRRLPARVVFIVKTEGRCKCMGWVAADHLPTRIIAIASTLGGHKKARNHVKPDGLCEIIGNHRLSMPGIPWFARTYNHFQNIVLLLMSRS